MKTEVKFEEAMLRLQEIVKKLEDGSADLDESIKLFEEGAKLSTVCYDRLKSAEQKITDLSKVDINMENIDEI